RSPSPCRPIRRTGRGGASRSDARRRPSASCAGGRCRSAAGRRRRVPHARGAGGEALRRPFWTRPPSAIDINQNRRLSPVSRQPTKSRPIHWRIGEVGLNPASPKNYILCSYPPDGGSPSGSQLKAGPVKELLERELAAVEELLGRRSGF